MRIASAGRLHAGSMRSLTSPFRGSRRGGGAQRAVVARPRREVRVDELSRARVAATASSVRDDRVRPNHRWTAALSPALPAWRRLRTPRRSRPARPSRGGAPGPRPDHHPPPVRRGALRAPPRTPRRRRRRARAADPRARPPGGDPRRLRPRETRARRGRRAPLPSTRDCGCHPPDGVGAGSPSTVCRSATVSVLIGGVWLTARVYGEALRPPQGSARVLRRGAPARGPRRPGRRGSAASSVARATSASMPARARAAPAPPRSSPSARRQQPHQSRDALLGVVDRSIHQPYRRVGGRFLSLALLEDAPEPCQTP